VVDGHVECNLIETECGTNCSPTAVSGRVDRTSVTPPSSDRVLGDFLSDTVTAPKTGVKGTIHIPIRK